MSTARLALVPFSRRHLTERYVGWLNDPEVVRFSEQRHRTHDIRSCQRYVRQMRSEGNLLWAIETRSASPGHIGNIAASFDASNDLAEISILLGERGAWGQGYGGEAWRRVLKWLAEDRRVRKIVGGTLSENHAMIGIMRSSHMTADGVRRSHYMVGGKPVDLVYFSYFSADQHRSQKDAGSARESSKAEVG